MNSVMEVERDQSAYNKRLQLDNLQAVRLHEYSSLVFYHANGHLINCD